MAIAQESSHANPQPQQRGSASYTFSSRPHATNTRYRFYDDQEQLPMYGNIMYDKRIRRGNTYAQRNLPVTSQPDPIEQQKEEETRRRLAARKKAKERLRPKSVEAVDGRAHVDIQTELYLEELTDRVEEFDAETQTDSFLDRPPTPLFVPAKTGKDVATQILEGELFNFDIEVKPILEVLVGKTIEQSLQEVVEEEELDNLRSRQRQFEELRNAELIETQRLEEQERRHREEKDRRMKQQLAILRKERETTNKVAARVYAQCYLQDLVPAVFGTLHNAGYFVDPVERDIETNFMETLMDEVSEDLMKVRVSRLILDSIIREVSVQRNQVYTKLNEEHEKKIRAQLDNLPKPVQPPTPTVHDEMAKGPTPIQEEEAEPDETGNTELDNNS